MTTTTTTTPVAEEQHSSPSSKSSRKKEKKEKKRLKKEAKRKRKEEKKKRKQKKRSHDDSTGEDYESSPSSSPEKKQKLNPDSSSASGSTSTRTSPSIIQSVRKEKHYKIVESSANPFASSSTNSNDQQNGENNVTLLLFYQYVDPPWDADEYKETLERMERLGAQLNLTGRMRVAKEGLNCTLTSTSYNDMISFCKTLRHVYRLKRGEFNETEFKLTTDLPAAQRLSGGLKIMPVTELVHYGLAKEKAPPISYTGTHLDPKDYHEKLGQSNTVVIDVRNHYEAVIGRFVPPSSSKIGESDDHAGSSDTTITAEEKTNSSSSSAIDGAKWLDPQMRKSTEFPIWLDKKETKEQLRGKQVLMYCTGGVRCERASALLRYKMEKDPEVRDLGIQGVYQLQGGIDKYFKDFPDGGYWKGKNYTFDKRFAHAPPAKEVHATTTTTKKRSASWTEADDQRDVEPDETTKTVAKESTASATTPIVKADEIMGQCEACHKPWDMFRGKRRCPTCGVPSLICRDCMMADKQGIRPLDATVRCELCVQQGIHSKSQIRQKEQDEEQAYTERMMKKGLLEYRDKDEDDGQRHKRGGTNQYNSKNKRVSRESVPNPRCITRLALRNMCKNNMTEEALMGAIPGITHIVWKTRGGDYFFGQGWVEMESPEAAARAASQSGHITLFGRKLYMELEAPDPKDAWPPPNSAV